MKPLNEEKLNIYDCWMQRRWRKRLMATDKIYWIYIQHTLNMWRIPEQFYDLRPLWWKFGKLPRKTYNFINPIMQIVNAQFSEKEKLRYHNVYVGKMTNEEFEYWYENCSMRSPEPKNNESINIYYERRWFIDKIEWWKDDVFNVIKESLAKTKTP